MNRSSHRLIAICLALAPAAFLGAGSGPAYVSEPVVPTLSPAVRDLPPLADFWTPCGPEMARRQNYGFSGPDQQGPPFENPLAALQSRAPAPDPPSLLAFGTPILNIAGYQSGSNPPDTTGDVGPNHFLQGVNSSGDSIVRIFNKAGTQLAHFEIDTLSSTSPCNSGYCDPIVNYDEAADRWVISEFSGSGSNFCVYVSTSPDPTGTWYAYTFNAGYSDVPDYPKYGVWPLDTNGDGQYLEGSYLIGVNAPPSPGTTRDVWALDRAKMLNGQPATAQKFTDAPKLTGWGFQLFLPVGHEGDAMPPAGNQPGIFLRPVDTEIHSGYTCAGCDVMEIWGLTVDWATPANSSFDRLPDIQIADYDHTLCGTVDWPCMPQQGTGQLLDPIREPAHFPLQYRNWGSYQTIVGCYGVDVNGTDQAAAHWFELRKTGAANWTLQQEGVVSGGTYHRSVCSAAMDSSGNIAIGYTRTSTTSYPSIYYSGRLATSPAGTMPYFDNLIINGTDYKSGDERWGDYSGIGVDPVDDCTFWYTTEYGGSGMTRIAAFKFDECGCLAVPAAPTASASVPGPNQINVSWNDSATATITRYWVYRATVSGGPYDQIAEVADTSPGAGGGAGYIYTDSTVSGGTRYYYIVKSNDGAACTSPASNEVWRDATGACTLSPTFAGITGVTNPANATCTLNLSWSAGTARCSGPLTYNVYRSTTSGFTPGPANRIATGVSATSYQDLDQLAYNTTYYYVVRAVDTSNGTEETNTTEMSGKPTGPITTGNLTETFEVVGGFDNAGWTHQAVSGGVDWVWSTAQSQTPTHSWFSASQTATAERVMVSPSFGVLSNTTLSFWHTYAFESASTCYDGGTLEISTNGGSAWTVIPDAAFTAGGFTGTASSGNPLSGKRAWCGGTIGAMTQVNVNLGAYAGQNALLRWHAGEDSSQAVTGWYIDSVTISNAGTASACAMGSNCSNNPSQVSVTPDGPLTLCTGTAQLLTATPTGGAGMTYQWYDGLNPIGGATSSTYSANTTATHSYNCQAKGTGCSSAMSDASPTQITWQAEPTFAGLTGVTNPAQATCRLDLAWSAGSSPCPGGVTYNVYRSTTPGFTPAVGNRIALGISGTSYQDSNGLVGGTTYYYKTRAVTVANGTEETNVVERSGAPTGAGGGPKTWLDEAFGSGIPGTWSVVDGGTGGGAAATWNTANPGGRTGVAPIVAPFAIVDSDNAGSSATQDEQLITPLLNIGTASSVILEFDQYFYYYSSGLAEVGDVDIRSSNTGGAWTNILRQTASSPNPEHKSITITTQAAGASDVQIRFRYYNGQYEWYWMVDNVKVSGVVDNPCATGSAGPPPVKDSGATAAKFTKGSGNTLDVTYDAATCSAQKVIILYGNIGTWTGYAGCAQNNGGAGGSTTINSAGHTATWYNLVWTSGTTSGHPGFATSGVRNWNVGTLCGMSTDDKTHTSCP